MKHPATGSTVPRPPLQRVLLIESGVLGAVSLLAWLLDATTGRSVLTGGLIFLVPQAWFAWRAFRFSGAGLAHEVVRSFYRAEAGKYLLTVAGFAIAFAYAGPLHAGALVSAYIAFFVLNGVMMPLFGGL